MLKIDNPLINKPLLFLAKFFYLGSWGKKYEIYKVGNLAKFKIRVGSTDKPTLWDVFRSGEYERHGFKVNKGDVVMDLGAHIGSFSVLASKMVGNTGKVFAFEPDKYSYELLSYNKNINKCSNMKLFNVAAWKESKSISFHSSDIDTWSSSVYRSDLENEYKVKAWTLPQMIKSTGKNIDLLKIDIEGVEFDIFENITKSDLNKVNKIVLEFHNFIENKPNKHKFIVNRLKKFGYNVKEYGVFPLSIPLFGLGIIAASKKLLELSN